MPFAVRLLGRLEVGSLERALDQIVSRHESLRTTFRFADGQLMQVIAAHTTLTMPVEERRDEGGLDAELVEEAERPFDLAEGPLIRARLLRLGAEEHVLLLTLHHIVADDWSMGVFVEEMAALYGAFARGEASPLAELPVQYADFAAWQREQLRGERLDEQLEYWRGRLGDGIAALDLPADRPRPPVQTYHGADVQVTLPAGCARQLRQLGGSQDASLFMTLLAGLAALLARYSGQDDLAVGTFIANRPRPELERLIGFFVNTLALRIDAGGDPTFAELLARARETCLGAYAHQDIPFEKLLEELHPERDLSRTPFFQVMLVVHNAPLPPLELPGASMTLLPLPTRRAHFDLTVHIEERDDGLSARFEYNTDLFDEATIAQLAGHYRMLLEAATADPGQRISQLPLLTAEEEHRLIVEWNDTASDIPIDACIHQLFEQQADSDAVAVIGATDRLTYRQLNQRANQLARYLRDHGAGPEIPIGICLDRTPEAIIAILAVLKSGSAYLPLDPHHPPQRLAHMLSDAAALLLITDRQQARQLPEHTGTTIYLDTIWPELSRYDDSNPDNTNKPSNLAYVIYTSGSTGTPKGAAIEHRSAVNVIRWLGEEFALGPDDRMLQFHELTVDTSVEEIFPTLAYGAALVLRPSAMIDSAEAFVKVCADTAVTILDLPAGYWHELTTGMSRRGVTLPPTVRLALVGGEKPLPDRIRLWREIVGARVTLLNTYGPTEGTILSTRCEIGLDPMLDKVPIGRPIPNVQAYVLDRYFNPVPVGVTGELYVGGANLARGYLGRPVLTADSFVPHPFENGRRLFRTRDAVRRLPDGMLEFVGRQDRQVKVRGFRVEPGEVEAALSSHPCIYEAAVATLARTPTDKRLTAYIAPEPGMTPLAVPELRRFLKDKLPEFMIPSAFMIIDELPRTATGKIDYLTLPELDLQRACLGGEYVQPRNHIEESLARTWQELLGQERIGIHDDFFDLGGYSLLGVQMLDVVKQLFAVELPLFTVFQMPTIAALSTAVSRALSERRAAAILSASEILSRVDDLPDDEIDALLATLSSTKEKDQK
jgi:amino acid adenylation domain-containing protein